MNTPMVVASVNGRPFYKATFEGLTNSEALAAAAAYLKDEFQVGYGTLEKEVNAASAHAPTGWNQPLDFEAFKDCTQTAIKHTPREPLAPIKPELPFWRPQSDQHDRL